MKVIALVVAYGMIAVNIYFVNNFISSYNLMYVVTLEFL